MRIDELFNTTYNYTWNVRNVEEWDGTFTTSDNSFIRLELSEWMDGFWYVLFDRSGNGLNSSVDDTGYGDSLKIFSTIIAMIREFDAEVKPNGYEFLGYKSDEPSARNSRIQLYRALARKFSNQFDVKEYDRDYRVNFKMVRKPQLAETASSGATAAGSVATVVGALGAGFDNDFSKSIYGSQEPVMIRRIPKTKKVKKR